jgi:hypothetical protein
MGEKSRQVYIVNLEAGIKIDKSTVLLTKIAFFESTFNISYTIR